MFQFCLLQFKLTTSLIISAVFRTLEYIMLIYKSLEINYMSMFLPVAVVIGTVYELEVSFN